MNYKLWNVVETFLIALINSIVFIEIAECAWILPFKMSAPLRAVGIVFGYCLLIEFTRKYCNKVIGFVLLHVLPLLVVGLFVPLELFEKVVVLIVCFVRGLSSCVFKAQRLKVEAAHPAFQVGVIFVFYLLLRRFVPGDEVMMAIYLAYVYAICFFLHLFLSGFLSFLEMEKRTNEQIPDQMLFREGGLLAASYSIVGVAAVILLTSREWADQIALMLKRLLGAIVRFLVSFLPMQQEVETEMVQEVRENVEMGMMPLPEPSAPLFIWILLEKIAFVAGGVLLLYLIYRGILLMMQTFLSGFAKPEFENTDLIEDLRMEEKQERLQKREKESFFKRFFHATTPNEKVRKNLLTLRSKWSKKDAVEEKQRAYVNNLFKEAFEEPADFSGRDEKTLSAREYLAGHRTGEEAKRFAALYEKARYSDQECSAEEVKEAAHLAQQLS